MVLQFIFRRYSMKALNFCFIEKKKFIRYQKSPGFANNSLDLQLALQIY